MDVIEELSFLEAGDPTEMNNMVELLILLQLEFKKIDGWMKVRDILTFLTSRAPTPHLLEKKNLVYASCAISSMIYRCETRSLLADVGLKFDRADD